MLLSALLDGASECDKHRCQYVLKHKQSLRMIYTSIYIYKLCKQEGGLADTAARRGVRYGYAKKINMGNVRSR